MFSLKIAFLFGLLCCFLLIAINGQDVGFPERGDEDVKRQNANQRKPIYMPGKCEESQLLYPGDLDTDWICDCKPGYLYHPETDKCYAAFRRGPCNAGSVLVLRKTKVIPECVVNSCKIDGDIPIKDKCYTLGTPGPCPSPELSYVLGVNVTTLEITCVKQSVDLANRIGEDADKPVATEFGDIPICAKGSKRFINGSCPNQLIPKRTPIKRNK